MAGAGIVSDGARMRLGGTERLVLLTAWLLPLYEITNALFKLPQIGPLVLTAVMSLILRRAAGARSCGNAEHERRRTDCRHGSGSALAER